MENLEHEARQHFQKLEKSIAYHEQKLQSDIPNGAKHMHEMEVAALKFIMEYAREALSSRGITV